MDQLKVKVTEEDAAAGDEPVSPTGQYFNSSSLNISIVAVFESDYQLDVSLAMAAVEKQFLPVSPRFSSVMIKDEKGVQRWKKVEVNLEDHIKTPIFISGLDFYDKHIEDYLTKLAMERLPPCRPLWELHLLKYPTRVAAGTAVFKLHHALGDGFSLMGALFSCLRRADDPSLPLTFPARRQRPEKRSYGSSFVEDDRTPVRSGEVGVEFRPLTISTVVFSLDDVRKVKDKLGVSLNDVISGVVFYGMQIYIKAREGDAGRSRAGKTKVTALLLLNTRNIKNYQSLEDMRRPGAESRWGNHFGFIHVSVPFSPDADQVDPLSFVVKGKQIIRAKMNSLGVYLTGKLLEWMRMRNGPEVTARYMYNTLRNTSATISNLTGPVEPIIMGNNPISNFYFMVVGVPQSLTISIVSYMGKLTLAMGTEKDFIDARLLVSSMETSFQKIYDAAIKRN
ncbi:hypothetical protein HPP92_028258 [Vanilla planifolia]|uniref:Diacylglycerol O-acyltransferase n=1 Tax=Vanilla planifolia TaxID=51239 RepID=A0A835P8I3_VANPL|nr:hypothetical protein HPP92_028258 [Vanilla planifolia]